jgi:hypothetical protein
MKTAIASNNIEPLLEGSTSVSQVSSVSLIPFVSPMMQNGSVAVAVPVSKKVADKLADKAADRAADNHWIKQVKAVVTEIKKTEGQAGDHALGGPGRGGGFPGLFHSQRRPGIVHAGLLAGWQTEARGVSHHGKGRGGGQECQHGVGQGRFGDSHLSAKDRVGCARALDIIAPFGVPIVKLVASEYAYFKLKLGDDVPLGPVHK